MCALAASGGLIAEELAELTSHLAKCDACREMLSQYRAVGTQGLPTLAGSYKEHHESRSWDDTASWKKLQARLCADQTLESKPLESARPARPSWLRRIRTRWFKRASSKKPSANTSK
jgi:hypothetical protein